MNLRLVLKPTDSSITFYYTNAYYNHYICVCKLLMSCLHLQILYLAYACQFNIAATLYSHSSRCCRDMCNMEGFIVAVYKTGEKTRRRGY